MYTYLALKRFTPKVLPRLLRRGGQRFLTSAFFANDLQRAMKWVPNVDFFFSETSYRALLSMSTYSTVQN